MIDLLFIPSTLLYLLVVGLLFIFGANFLYLTAVALRKRQPQIPLPLHYPGLRLPYSYRSTMKCMWLSA